MKCAHTVCSCLQNGFVLQDTYFHVSVIVIQEIETIQSCDNSMCFSLRACRVFLEHNLPVHLHVICSDCCAVVVELVFTETLTVDRAGDVCCLVLYILHGEGVCVRQAACWMWGSAVGSGGREKG